MCQKEKLLVLSNFFFSHYVFKMLPAAEASESIYLRERVNPFLHICKTNLQQMTLKASRHKHDKSIWIKVLLFKRVELFLFCPNVFKSCLLQILQNNISVSEKGLWISEHDIRLSKVKGYSFAWCLTQHSTFFQLYHCISWVRWE